MTHYQRAREHFVALCHRYSLPVPGIMPHRVTDKCDHTSPALVRLNSVTTTLGPEDHAAHVFGHWLCNLEGTSYSDRVADLIAGWVSR